MTTKPAALAARWLALKAEADATAAALKVTAAQLLVAMDAKDLGEVVTPTGVVRIRERRTPETRLNTKRLMAEHPDAYRACVDAVAPTVTRYVDRA